MARRKALAAAVVAGLALAAFTPVARGEPTPQGFRQNDAGGFRAILPPGTNGFVNLVELAAFQGAGVRPAHNDDQFAPYRDLVFESGSLSADEIDDYFHPADFGVRPGQITRSYSPREDVTILRDQLGVPHVYGQTRAGAMFGLGYVGAEDRLFFMDALRNAGRGQLSSFAGGGNIGMDRDVWASSPYTEADLRRQVNYTPPGYARQARIIRSDATNYVAGVNLYIAEARVNPLKMPGEYAAIGRPQGPEDWSVTDIVATGALIGGIFGGGGGGELNSARVLEAARERFGRRGGFRVWRDFRSANDPEAPTTVHGRRFPYEIRPRRPRGVALPDPGTLVLPGAPAHRAAPDSGEAPFEGLLAPLQALLEPGAFPSAASNALLVSAAESQGGRPVAVMGPQVAYFAPQILLEQDVHAPGIDARGAAFPGISQYVLLGRGRDYAWSATSAGQDIIDTFAVPLCEPGGGRATIHSDHYRFRGRCLPIEVLERHNSWTPSLADSTPSGSETLVAERTKLGIVAARARVRGKPVIYTRLRSTYFHEVESALGFAQLNSPRVMNGPADFQRAAHKINFTFNWFYIDRDDIAYFNSGWNPARAPGTDPNFPVASRFEWRRFDAATGNSARTPFAAHPQAINQRFLSSWNNKQAPGYAASDGIGGYGPVYRVDALNERIRAAIRGPRKASLTELIKAMEGGATVDLRGHTVLPLALRVIGNRGSAKLRGALAKLRAWARSGAHRIDRDRNGSYEHSDAIRIFDAWYEGLLRVVFQPTLGKDLFDLIASVNRLDDEPNRHRGSAYNGGWYMRANKDLRTLLGDRVRGRYSRVYCGRGNRARCRKALSRSLLAALDDDPYGENAGCGVGDAQMCFDAIQFRATGGTTQPDIAWQNRPTFQQAIQVRP